MRWLVIAMIVGLAVIAYPSLAAALNRMWRKRRSHRGGLRHWYTNFDDRLQYEPVHDQDIVELSLSELDAAGYRPEGTIERIPRTFRHRIAGDHRIRLWRNPAAEAEARWICES